MRKSLLVVLLVLTASVLLAQNRKGRAVDELSSAHLPGPAISALQTINPEHIRQHVRFLSHDLL